MKMIYRAFWLCVILLFIKISYTNITLKKDIEVLQERKPVVVEVTREVRVLVDKYTVDDAVTKAAELTGIDAKFIKAQWIHETGHFKSRRAISNKNLAGIAVFNDSAEGGVYYDYQHFAYEYAKNIKRKYPQLIGCQDIDNFVNGLQDYKYRWAQDKEYKQKIKKIYSKL